MKWKVTKSSLGGTLVIPPSKSHTIRALLIGTLAEGVSVIRAPLLRGDGASALRAARGLGARVDCKDDTIKISGISGNASGGEEWIDLGNSGTGLRLFAAAAALGAKGHWFTGDDSLKARPMKPLLNALNDLGANYVLQSPNRDIPFYISGPLAGGTTRINGFDSQFVSSLLLSCPCAQKTSVIQVENLHERPYVDITLWWLDKMGIRYTASADRCEFTIEGKQRYRGFDERISGDFSSATFSAVAAALLGCSLSIENIDFTDPQGDKEIFTLLETLGVSVTRSTRSAVVTGGLPVRGGVIDLNSMPDALPAIAVLACTAQGTTSIVNVAQARIKETDRIHVMTQELSKMGAVIQETDDGVIVNPSTLRGCHVHGHHDHRVVMALALAGMIAEGETIIDTAESAAITYPSFAEDFRAAGAAIEILEQEKTYADMR